MLIVISYIDIKRKRIPNILCAAIIILGFISAGVSDNINILERLTGAIIVGGIMIIISILSRGGIGGGDIKLIVCSEVVMGMKNIISAVMISMLMAGMTGVILILLKKKNKADNIVLGPFISIGIIVSVLWENQIWDFIDKI